LHRVLVVPLRAPWLPLRCWRRQGQPLPFPHCIGSRVMRFASSKRLFNVLDLKSNCLLYHGMSVRSFIGTCRITKSQVPHRKWAAWANGTERKVVLRVPAQTTNQPSGHESSSFVLGAALVNLLPTFLDSSFASPLNLFLNSRIHAGAASYS
jgi:hypothetical protein